MFSATVEPVGTLARALIFTTSPFDSDTEVLGPSEFTLYVTSPTSPTVDLIARLFDVAPEGTETEVTIGVIRVTGLLPNQISRITFRDFGDDWIFRTGHALRVKLTNIDFPDFRPPGTNDEQPSIFTVRTGKKFPSSVKLVIGSS